MLFEGLFLIFSDEDLLSLKSPKILINKLNEETLPNPKLNGRSTKVQLLINLS